MQCVICAAMRRRRLLEPLSWRPSAAAAIFLCVVSVSHASYEKTCTIEDRLRPRGICGQPLTDLIATLCESQYNKRNIAASPGSTGGKLFNLITEFADATPISVVSFLDPLLPFSILSLSEMFYVTTLSQVTVRYIKTFH